MTDSAGKASSDRNDLVFLPQPWQVNIAEGEGVFALDWATRIQLGPAAGEATAHAAHGLREAVDTGLGLPLPVARTGGRLQENVISLILSGRDDAAFGQEAFAYELPAELGDQAYALDVTADRIVVVAFDEAGLFYGVQTLIQLVQGCGRALPALSVLDRPVLPRRGVMLDISRMKVLTPETLAATARTLAHYKYNQLQVYTEHTYRFRTHPRYTTDDGALSANDVLALDEVCRAHHIDLVPNFQSLGHQRELLENPRYEHLSETAWHWSLATDNDETFTFLDELYTELLPNFSSSYFNVDADEPWDMGQGVSKAMTDEIGPGRVYLHHIKRLHELVTGKHGRTMMMWADMFWHHPDLIGEFPADIVLLDWWYEPKERFETVDVLANAKRRFYVCPGTGSWMSLFPRIERSIVNTQGFVRDGVEAGAEGMLMTDWGDNGHFGMLSLSWYPFLWAADCGWTGATTDIARFDDAFSRLFLHDASGRQVAAIRELGRAIGPIEGWSRISYATVGTLWGEPLLGETGEILTPDVVAELRAAAAVFDPLLDGVRDATLRHDLGFAAAQIRFVCDQVEATRSARATLRTLAGDTPPTDDGAQRLDTLIAEFRRLQTGLAVMREEFEARWEAHARHSQIGVNLERYARAHDQYGRAISWLEGQRAAYMAGTPLDTELATYDKGDFLTPAEETERWLGQLIEIIGYDNLPPDVKGWVSRPHDEEEAQGAIAEEEIGDTAEA
jgi:hexosaminidase